MEKEERIVKVYSNNSKKARLKRNKNKFQRIWDAEKQTYVKVRKAKYQVFTKQEKKDWRVKDLSNAVKRRQTTDKKPKSVPVTATKQKPEIKQSAHKTPTTTVKKANVVKIHGMNLTWDSKLLRYKKAA